MSFRDYVIIAYGTVSPELNHLKKQGFLDAKKSFIRNPEGMKFPENSKGS
ncbi:MAG: hypothetical protein Kow0099_30780 [Candidatus Abyssubacteria bacterium]